MSDRCACHTHAGLAPGQHLPYLRDKDARIAELEAENNWLKDHLRAFEDAMHLASMEEMERFQKLEAENSLLRDALGAVAPAALALILGEEVSEGL